MNNEKEFNTFFKDAKIMSKNVFLRLLVIFARVGYRQVRFVVGRRYRS